MTQQATAPPRRSPLEDQRSCTRGVVALLGIGLGVLAGHLAAMIAGVDSGGAPLWLTLLPILLGCGASIVASISTAVCSIRADRAARRALAAVAGAVATRAAHAGAPLPARVTRRRVLAGAPAVGVDARSAEPVRGTSSLAIVVDVLLPDVVRRVVVLTPSFVPLAALAKGSTHLVRLVPGHPDVGVLDVTGDQAALAAAAADPRWVTTPRPSAGTVVGGWRPIALIAVGCLLAGAAIGVGLALYASTYHH